MLLWGACRGTRLRRVARSSAAFRSRRPLIGVLANGCTDGDPASGRDRTNHSTTVESHRRVSDMRRVHDNTETIMWKRLLAIALVAITFRAYATDFTDIWWNPAESGWGVNMAQNEDV